MSRKSVIAALLRTAGIESSLKSSEVLPIGSAGLVARGNKDEDGTHTRIRLEDGRSFIVREFDSRGLASQYLRKEMSMFRTLAPSGVPVPHVLASTDDSAVAALLSDAGGAPLEVLLTSMDDSAWSNVGAALRRLHEVDVASFEFLTEPVYQRPWTRFVSYFAKALKTVKQIRPDLAPCIDELLTLRRALQEWFDARPRAVCFGAGYYPPGIMLAQEDSWRCTSWLSLGYYVSISDPARDAVSLVLAHEEWTGNPMPSSFFESYGRPPDELARLVYRAALLLKRGAVYQRGGWRTGWGPPPHTRAVEELAALPRTVSMIRELLSSR